jgi:alpha-tubulin suppressor-like RCC1 family protein
MRQQLPDVLRPQYLDSLAGVRMVCVAAGELHSASVSQDGDVYTWGDGFCGQVGHGDKRPQLTPRQVTQGGLEDEVVSSISCGSRHTLAVTEDGLVFSWGFHFEYYRSYNPSTTMRCGVENLMGVKAAVLADAVVHDMVENGGDGDGEPELGRSSGRSLKKHKTYIPC